MGIHKSGQNNSAAAINLSESTLVLLDPWIFQRIARFPCRNNLPGDAKHSCVGNNAQFSQGTTASRTANIR